MDIDERTDKIEHKFYEVTMRANSTLITADKCRKLVQEVKEVKKF